MNSSQDIDQFRPKRIMIVPDDYHAVWVGKTSEDLYFFVTNPFVPAGPDHSELACEFIAVFLWNKDGSFKEAKIDNLGPRSQLDHTKASQLFKSRIAELGDIKIMPITIEPFQVHMFGVEFGLIYKRHLEEGQDEEDVYECVELHPGNYMAFNPPWDGDYDT